MNKASDASYLFLLARPSVEARHEAASRLRELGMRVTAQYGNIALEGLGTADQLRKARETGLFSASLSGKVLKEHLEKLTDEQRKIVDQWNTRFTPSYRNLAKDFTHVGKSWGGEEGLAEPLPYTAISPEEFLRLLDEYEKRTGESLRRPSGQQGKAERMAPEEFVRYERELARTYNDATLAYHLTRLAYRLGPNYYTLIEDLPQEIIKGIHKDFFPEADCWRMNGDIAVGIVFVESSRDGGPRFEDAERNEICQRILDGHSWLVSQHPTGELSWVYDIQFVRIDVANGSGDPDEEYWRDPAMGQVAYAGHTYSASWDGVAEYRADLRSHNLSDHALVILVTPYVNFWHGYANGGRITLANKNNWGGWGRSALDMITAHETSHLFGSSDEYTNSGTPCSSCDTTHGCDNIPNGNCGACAHPTQYCVMNRNSRRLCGYTRAHIGWGPLFLETTTADELWAGTDDDVWLDIGNRTFVVDTPDHNDREQGNREGYAFYEPALARSEIKRILIRKSPDGFAGGWKLQGVRVWHHGELVCDQNSINQWLEGGHRWWVGCINDTSYINSLSVDVHTADVWWAGTDDDVMLTLARNDWNLDNPGRDDFERGNTDTFDLDPGTGLRVADAREIRITKSPDGFSGGWRLQGITLKINGSQVYNNQSINKWLEGNDRSWAGTF